MRISKFFFLAVVACALLVTSCTKKPKLDLSGVRTNPSANGGAGAVGENGDGFGAGEFVAGPTDFGDLNGNGGDGLDGAGLAGLGAGSWGSTDAPVAGSEASNFVKNGQRWNQAVVYFGYDQSDIAASERAKLDVIGKYMNENPGKGLVIEGHTDERGSDEYNRALGERRALAVQQYLNLLGVADNRMQTISYGEDKPAVSNATSNSDHQKNRRAEFVIGDL